MKVIRWDKEIGVVQLDKREVTENNLIFDLTELPQDVEPKTLVLRDVRGDWELSWSKFGRQQAIGDIAMIERAKFKFTPREKKAKR